MKSAMIALAGLAVALAVPAAAQDKEEGAAVTVEFIKFKSGAITRIDEIESKYFDPAARKVGFAPQVIRFATGEWDREYLFPMAGGMADLDYKMTKQQAAWLAEVDKLAGGAGTGRKLLAEFDSLVERSSNQVGFTSQR